MVDTSQYCEETRRLDIMDGIPAEGQLSSRLNMETMQRNLRMPWDSTQQSWFYCYEGASGGGTRV